MEAWIEYVSNQLGSCRGPLGPELGGKDRSQSQAELGAVLREMRDSAHSVEEGSNAAFPENAKTGNCFVKALRLSGGAGGLAKGGS